MLILTQMSGQEIEITIPDGRVIVISCLAIDTFKRPVVRLGFEAPRDCAIVRKNAKQRTKEIIDNDTKNGNR